LRPSYVAKILISPYPQRRTKAKVKNAHKGEWKTVLSSTGFPLECYLLATCTAKPAEKKVNVKELIRDASVVPNASYVGSSVSA